MLAYVITRILDTPFWGLYNLLFFILYKDLGATPFQIALLVMIKPLTSFLAIYWSSFMPGSKGIVWARAISFIPFLFTPFISSPWVFIAISALYMMLTVGTVPTWMEVLKQNLSKKAREKTFAYTQAFGYLGGGLLPFLIGGLLDHYDEAWRWLFPIVALLSLSALFFQRNLQVKTEMAPKEPLGQAITLLKNRPDFRKFQFGFFFLGAGLMLFQPALPVFYVDTLHLSYTELAVAITLCKGIGFMISTPWWTEMLHRMNLFPFSSLIALLACLFPIFLLFATSHLLWLYSAYLLYGIVQAGSELSWNMSGPEFARDQNSSQYSTVNLLFVGLRGTFIPALGSLLLSVTTSPVVLMLGALLCLGGAFSLAHFSKEWLPE